MANTLTNLLPNLYEALDIISRELVGFIPAVMRDSTADRASLNQNVVWPVVPSLTATDFSPAATGPNPSDITVEGPSLTLNKSKSVPVYFTGEDIFGLNTGPGFNQVLTNSFSQAFRTLCNLIEADLFAAAYKGASRAYGTAGTLPFGTANDLSDIAMLRKILEDNGAPTGDFQLVLSNAAAAQLRGKQPLLFRANEAGTSNLLRQGIFDPIEGFAVRQSGQVQAVTKGTGTLYVTSGSTAANAAAVALVTGSGTVLAGDVVTFAADANNKYVVNTGVAAPGTINLGNPGAQMVIPTGNALTIGNNYTPLVGFDRSAIVLATRTPALPAGGDSATDVIEIQDPVSGLAFQVAEYKQYGRVAYDVRIVWGCAAVKNNHIATLLS